MSKSKNIKSKLKSKSVLIIDTPKDCSSCPLLDSFDECIMIDDDINGSVDNLDDLRTNYCPLMILR